MTGNHSNKSNWFGNLIIVLIFGPGIIGATFLHIKIHEVSIWEMVPDQGWYLVILALVEGIASGFLRWRFWHRNFINGLLHTLNLVVAYILSGAIVRYFQAPDTLGGWLMMTEVGVHFLMKVVVDSLSLLKPNRKEKGATLDSS